MKRRACLNCTITFGGHGLRDVRQLEVEEEQACVATTRSKWCRRFPDDACA